MMRRSCSSLMSRMVVVILLRLHKGIHNALVIILIDKDGVDSAGQLELVLNARMFSFWEARPLWLMGPT